MNIDVLEAIAYSGAFDMKIFEDNDLLNEKAKLIVNRLNQLKTDIDIHWDYEIDYTTELKITKTHKGVKTEYLINQKLFTKPESIELGKHQNEVESIFTNQIIFEKKEDIYNINTPIDVRLDSKTLYTDLSFCM